MQTARILQAVILMMILAMAASCTVAKQYTSKLFAPRLAAPADSQATAARPLRFLEMDSAVQSQENWVTTDIIMGRDTSSGTTILDNFAKTFPAGNSKKDTVTRAESEPVPAIAPGTYTRQKTSGQENVPVARAANPGEVRNKRTREK